MSENSSVKVMVLLKRKPGMSMEEFIDYYENHHVPLILRILPFQIDYRRNYVRQDGALASMDAQPADYDVVAEARFATQEIFERFCVEGAKPEIREQVIADEMNFVDRDNLRFFIVDEYVSAIQPVPAF